MQLGTDAGSSSSFGLAGTAIVTNSPCIGSLTFSGRQIGEAFRLTDSAKSAVIIALPVVPPGPIYQSFNFSYKFEPAATSCAGDFGRGVVTADKSPWDY
jgi:hypothetical protein